MEKKIIEKDLVRKVSDSFAFIPHRFREDGFIKYLALSEIALYFFLILAADRLGLSYYGNSAISKALKITEDELLEARLQLIKQRLIAFESPCYQVLELPGAPVKPKTGSQQPLHSFASLVGQIGPTGRGCP